MKTNVLRVALLLAALPAAAQSGPKFSYSGDVRLRWEGLSTPSASAAADEDYDFTHARARLTLDLEGSTWKLHATGQGAAARSLPDNAAFGIGRSYWLASDREEQRIGWRAGRSRPNSRGHVGGALAGEF